MVHTVTSRVMRNAMDAEEVTQDVFVKAFQRLQEFEGTGKFSTWLYSIAYRTAISAIRGRKDPGASLDELKESGTEPYAEHDASLADRRKILEHALATLAPEDAAILTMFHLEEMSVEEIVTVTGLGASNVKVRLHRGRKKLHEILRLQLKDELWTMHTNE
ncbi:MAG: sigma-70 family RNA polymerase sigma factor [Flavobacteriales bacterium]|nr:sigma-70 family RNA polymerase sigma factor [Flavobacteriales bacterium]